MCTNNQYPHVVSVCTVYASVTWKSYRRIAAWNDSIQTFTYPDDLTDVYGCGYGDMETRQRNLMGAILFLQMRIQIQMRIPTKGDIA